MEDIWKMYEYSEDLVYVMDASSYEIVYMNKKARKFLKEYSSEGYEGKRCYELFQRFGRPCFMCTHRKFQPQKFFRWYYFNPVLGKYMLLKNIMLKNEGREYRVEIVYDVGSKRIHEDPDAWYENLDMMVNNAVGIALEKSSPDETISCFLEQIGYILYADQCCVFEFNSESEIDGAYEWLKEGASSRKDYFRNIPANLRQACYEQLQKYQNIMIGHIEEIRDTHKEAYDYLRGADILSLVLVPLYHENQIIGFYGIANAPEELLMKATSFLHIMKHFIAIALDHRNLIEKLKLLSYRDQLTRLGNRHLLAEYVDGLNAAFALGILFCDINQLKWVNDHRGHKEGDALIIRAADCLREIFGEYGLFRLGGDELLALCPELEEKDFQEKARRLQELAAKNKVSFSVGTCWTAKAGRADNIERLISYAETKMYEDKQIYYQTTGADRRR